MIILTDNLDHFRLIAGLVDKIPNAEYTAGQFYAWLVENYNKEHFKVWIDTDEKEQAVHSFLIAQVVKPMFDDEMFIPLSYVKPGSSVGHELLQCAEDWAKTQQIRSISIFITRREKAFTEKYGFQFQHIGMIKRLHY